MRNVLFPLVLLALTGCGEAWHIKQLSDEEFKAYYALKPFMSEDQKHDYLWSKTDTERTAYLKEQGLYDKFYKYGESQRQAIVDGAVAVGWEKDMVLMAWGAPYDKRKLTGRPAPRSEMLVYRFEKHADGSVLVYVPDSKTEYKATERFIREVYLDSDVVAEIIEKPGWGQ